ncbi:replication protein RepA [Glutamicibacter ardleyensis]|uniref:replication protein RepA n=1 Tax=Glutamicibacter ardleyensis TaxID=225894 RepID=UPI003FD589AD
MLPDNSEVVTPPTRKVTSQKSERVSPDGKLPEVLELSLQKKKFLDFAQKVSSEKPDELSFGIDFMAETCLPVSDPGSDLRVYEKRNGKLTLEIQPARIRNPDGTSEFVYPWGVFPRRIMIWIVTEALRTRNPRLYLGPSLQHFMEKKLRVNEGGSQRQAIRRATLALLRASISVTALDSHGNLIVDEFENFHIAQQGRILTHINGGGVTNPEDNEDSYILLNQGFYERIVGRDGEANGKAFPVDMRAVDALGKDALALDIYLWTVLRVYRAGKGTRSVTIKWSTLHRQFGTEIAETYRFKQKFLKAINKVALIYPGLNYESDRKEFTLLSSELAIAEDKTRPRKPKLRNKSA